jgi:hypothetical protein
MRDSRILSTGRPSPLVLVARLILLLVAAALVGAGFALAWGPEGTVVGSGSLYACPMHPEVTSSDRAECTICRMALEPVQAAMGPVPFSAEASTLDTLQRGGRPSLSAGNGGDVRNGGHAREPPSTGTAKRQRVTMDIRAPASVEEDGVLAAILYQDEVGALSSDEPALFFPAAQPGLGMAVRRTNDPPARWDESTTKVRLRLESAASTGLRLRDVGWVKFGARSSELLVVPSSALLPSSEGIHVLLPEKDGHSFIKRRVQIGKVRAGHVAVLSGLEEDERVVVVDAFLADAERRMQQQRAQGPGEVAE